MNTWAQLPAGSRRLGGGGGGADDDDEELEEGEPDEPPLSSARIHGAMRCGWRCPGQIDSLIWTPLPPFTEKNQRVLIVWGASTYRAGPRNSVMGFPPQKIINE